LRCPESLTLCKPVTGMRCQKRVGTPPKPILMPRPHLARALLPVALLLSAFANPLRAQTLTVSQVREDFDVLWKAITEAHGGLVRFQTRDQLDAKVAAHRARLNQPMTQLEFAAVISESLAELRDGHARLEFDSATVAVLQAGPVMPLRVALEEGKVIVAFNDTPTDATIRPGMEVVSINGRSAPEIVRQMLPKISGDGFIETGKAARLAREFALYYWLYVERPASFRVVARENGREVTAVLPGIVERDRRQVTNPVNATMVANMNRLDPPRGNVALDFLEQGTVARLRIRGFEGASFLTTLDSAFKVIADRGTPSLLLDLRGNGGGVDDWGAKLVSYFADRPFRYFDHIAVRTIAPSFATWLPRTFEAMRTGSVPDSNGGFRITTAQHRGVGPWEPAANRFRGKVAVLIDGGTFSTAADVAAQLKSMRRATFLGEEAGGGYEGNTSGLNALIVMPHSRLRMRIMMYDYWNAVTPPAQRGRGVMPDIVIPRRVADFLSGVDPALPRAIAVVR
jgi:hypothetical protein